MKAQIVYMASLIELPPDKMQTSTTLAEAMKYAAENDRPFVWCYEPNPKTHLYFVASVTE